MTKLLTDILGVECLLFPRNKSNIIKYEIEMFALKLRVEDCRLSTVGCNVHQPSVYAEPLYQRSVKLTTNSVAPGVGAILIVQ